MDILQMADESIGATRSSRGKTARKNSQKAATKLKNPSLQVTPDHDIKLVDAPVSTPGEGEVLVHIKATGISRSDIKFWKRGRIDGLKVTDNCILGHEAAGVVVDLGPGVHSISIGDRVGVEPGIPCGSCFLCLNGRYNLCQEVVASAIYPQNGTMQRYKTHPVKWLHKLPENISFAEAALLEPLSVVLHAIRRAKIEFGRGVLISGAGPIGLIALAVAKASGCHPIVVTDISQERLDFAHKFIPSCRLYHSDSDASPQDNAREIRHLYETEALTKAREHSRPGLVRKSSKVDGQQTLASQYGAPVSVLECTGVESSILTASYVIRWGGTIMVIGVDEPITYNLALIYLSEAEIDIRFSNRYCDTWPVGISALSGGVLNLKPLITHSYPLEEAEQAMQACAESSPGTIKVQVVDDGDE